MCEKSTFSERFLMGLAYLFPISVNTKLLPDYYVKLTEKNHSLLYYIIIRGKTSNLVCFYFFGLTIFLYIYYPTSTQLVQAFQHSLSEGVYQHASWNGGEAIES